jgi:hypothetical protein
MREAQRHCSHTTYHAHLHTEHNTHIYTCPHANSTESAHTKLGTRMQTHAHTRKRHALTYKHTLTNKHISKTCILKGIIETYRYIGKVVTPFNIHAQTPARATQPRTRHFRSPQPRSNARTLFASFLPHSTPRKYERVRGVRAHIHTCAHTPHRHTHAAHTRAHIHIHTQTHAHR